MTGSVGQHLERQHRGSNRSLFSAASSSSNCTFLEFKRLQPCSIARQDMAIACVSQDNATNGNNGSIVGVLVVGGRSEEADLNALNVVELFDWSSKRWRSLPSLQQARCGCAVATLDKSFYVFGGVGDRENCGGDGGGCDPSSSVETFTLGGSGGEWKPTGNMPQARWYASAVSFPISGDIVLLGGRDPSQWTELDTVEAFDTNTHEWTPLASMSRPRFGCGATRIAESILLVVGGYDGTEWTAKCELYDYAEDEWSTDIADMPVDGLQFVTATTVTDDLVLVMGQNSEETDASVLMVYQVSQNTWTVLPVMPPGVAEELTGGAIVAAGNKLLAVGGVDLQEGLATKNTRISINLMSVLQAALTHPHQKLQGDATKADDATVTTYRSSSSASRSIPNGSGASTPPSVGEEAESIHPLWSSPTHKRSSLGSSSLISSSCAGNGPVSHISLGERAESMEDSMASISYTDHTEHSDASTYMASPSQSGKRRVKPKRKIVENVEMVDCANGSKVIYTGSTLLGIPSGKGKMVWENGDSYAGAFKQGNRHGKGCMSYKDGRQYEGRFVANQAHDPNGQMTWKDGTIYVGSFVQGKRTGSGIQRFPSKVRYEGEFVNGKYHGTGVCVFADGSLYDGEWIRGQAHGHGVLRDKHGKTLHNGLWQNDSPVM